MSAEDCFRSKGDKARFIRHCLVTDSLFDFYVEALDFLVERRERDAEVFGGLGLVPVAALETVGYDATLDLLHQVEEGGVGFVFEQARRVSIAGELRGKQLGRDRPGGGEDDASFHGVLELADVSGLFVVHEDSKGFGGEDALACAVLVGIELEEVRGQQGDVLAAGA